MNTPTLSYVLSAILGRDVEFVQLGPDEHQGHGPAYRAMWEDDGRINSVTYFVSDADAANVAQMVRGMNDVSMVGNVRFASTVNP